MKKLVLACISLAIFAGNGLAQGGNPKLSSADLKGMIEKKRGPF